MLGEPTKQPINQTKQPAQQQTNQPTNKQTRQSANSIQNASS
jgi:hypothetical protein